jgi:hypothetical protein
VERWSSLTTVPPPAGLLWSVQTGSDSGHEVGVRPQTGLVARSRLAGCASAPPHGDAPPEHPRRSRPIVPHAAGRADCHGGSSHAGWWSASAGAPGSEHGRGGYHFCRANGSGHAAAHCSAIGYGIARHDCGCAGGSVSDWHVCGCHGGEMRAESGIVGPWMKTCGRGATMTDGQQGACRRRRCRRCHRRGRHLPLLYWPTVPSD